MVPTDSIPWGRPLANRYTFYADRRLGLRQRRNLERDVRNLCVRKRWHLIVCNAGATRVQVVVGGADSIRLVHRVLLALCEDSRPQRTWDTSAPIPLMSSDDVVEACTRVLYESTDGVMLVEV